MNKKIGRPSQHHTGWDGRVLEVCGISYKRGTREVNVHLCDYGSLTDGGTDGWSPEDIVRA